MSYRMQLTLISLLITRMLFAQLYTKPVLYSLDKGLSNPSVLSLAIDSRGYIWTGTENGLYRYDGYRFKLIGQPPGKTGMVGSKRIYKILDDTRNNTLWLLTSAGIELYNRKTGVITVYSSQLLQTGTKPIGPLVDLFVTPDQVVWIISKSGLYKMLPGSSVRSFPAPNGNTDLTCITGDTHGNLWIGSLNGMLLFDRNTEKYTSLFDTRNNLTTPLTSNAITCLYLDREENLWIGTRQGINQFDPVNIDFTKLYPVPEQKVNPANDIRCIEADREGNLVMVTGRGIVIYHPAAGRFEFPNIEIPDQLLHARHASIRVDPLGILWMGTNHGLVKIRKSPVSIENYFSGKNLGYSIPENDITALWEDASGNLWAGYRNSGILVYDRSGRTIARYQSVGTGNGSLSGNSVQSFYLGNRSDFYCVTANAIDKFNPLQKRFEPLLQRYPFMDKRLLGDRNLLCMTEDSLGNFLVGTSDGILMLDIINQQNKLFTVLRRDQDSLVLSRVYALAPDRLNTLWAGNDDGLVWVNLQDRTFNRYTPYEKELLNTGHKRVYTLLKGGLNTLWIGTSEGCYQFDMLKKTFSALSGSNELVNSEVMSMASDRSGNLWIATSQGVFNYAPSNGIFRHFDFSDGLENYSFNLNASVSGKSNKVFLGGQFGLSVIQSNTDLTEASSPPTVITSVSILKMGRVDREFNEVPDTLVVPYGNHAVKIEFMLPDYHQSEKNQYQYQFYKEGKDAGWVELNTSNSVTLSGMNQGNFHFKVAGSTRNGEWNSQQDELILAVQMPFWRTKPAYTIYFAILLVLMVLTFRYWARQLINANKQYREKEKIARQIMLQKEELTLKNKSITDSINYARRIQNAMLPPIKLLKSYFPNSFLLYLPKDIVSGDFYWINKLYNKIFIAAVDCTGHGVPGAFMSIIGFELFRKITNIEGLARPSDILNKLNEDFHEIFRDVDNIILRDGMDVAFCAIDINDMILEYSGAFNPLYLIRDNKITEIKGDRFAIGLDETNFKDQTFKNHMIPLQEGDLIYIFSDGFADQFGGPEGKKFKYRRFRHLLLNIHQIPMEDQHNILETSLKEWKGDLEQVDDVMVMGIKIDF